MNAVSTTYQQLQAAHATIVQLNEKLRLLSAKCFKLNNERSKWEQRYKNVKARLDRLSYGPQAELFVDPSGARVAQDDVSDYYTRVQPNVAVTIPVIAAWVAAGRPEKS